MIIERYLRFLLFGEGFFTSLESPLLGLVMVATVRSYGEAAMKVRLG